MHKKLQADKKYMQRILKFAGYDCGVVDGIVGNKTLAAVAKWDADEQAAIKEYGTLDSRSEDNLTTLVPSAQRAIRKWFKQRVEPWMTANGVVVKIICGTRTYAELDALYAQGRTTKGSKVTNARGGYSFHNWGIAADTGIFLNGKYLESDKMYIQLVKACGTPDGFINGGSWKSITDWPHYQCSQYGSTIAEIRSKFNR